MQRHINSNTYGTAQLHMHRGILFYRIAYKVYALQLHELLLILINKPLCHLLGLPNYCALQMRIDSFGLHKVTTASWLSRTHKSEYKGSIYSQHGVLDAHTRVTDVCICRTTF